MMEKQAQNMAKSVNVNSLIFSNLLVFSNHYTQLLNSSKFLSSLPPE